MDKRVKVSTQFSYLAQEIDDLENALSADRFRPYVQMAQGDRVAAIRLYERNTRFSGALYCSIQGLEVCLRNAVHRSLTAAYGPDWFDHLTMLRYPLPQKLEAAKSNILGDGKLLTPGRVVAELSFGFWTALLSAKYEKCLWVPCLHRAFPYAFAGPEFGTTASGAPRRVNRQDIARRLDGIRQLRNRIAHHESIIRRRLDEDFLSIIETTAWICPTTSAWLNATAIIPS
jgi:hypothetical protein